MLRRRRVLGLVVIATLLVVIASEQTISAAEQPTTTSGSGSVATIPSACALLTSDDLHSILGGTASVGDLTTAPTGRETICEWTIVTSANGDGFAAQLDIKSPFLAKEFKQQRQIATGSTKTVKHLGDAAFSERAKIGSQVFDDLWVHKGPTAFRLEVLKDLGSKPLARLASIVLTRLAATDRR